ncbi:MAG: hypothetical protein IKP65_01125, partial [Alphaproteobacteria bacterium]|nr:hypothetical protein [Alphaproteobacteria bacterium]
FQRAFFVIIVYDISNEESFDHLQEWAVMSKEKAPPDCSIVIIGNKSHDLKFTAEQATTVTIGNHCDIREFTNIHAGTPNGPKGTWIGNNVFLMSHTHIGHDCQVRDGALLSQATTLGGEVIIQEKAIIGGCSAIHQFCTVGKYAIVGGCSKITQDVIPFSMSDGNP